jgi:hypothetical protein
LATITPFIRTIAINGTIQTGPTGVTSGTLAPRWFRLPKPPIRYIPFI